MHHDETAIPLNEVDLDQIAGGAVTELQDVRDPDASNSVTRIPSTYKVSDVTLKRG